MLTIATQNNGETVYFEDLIPKVHFIKLIPCSFYNSWHTLKNKGSAELGDRKVSLGKIPRTLLFRLLHQWNKIHFQNIWLWLSHRKIYTFWLAKDWKSWHKTDYSWPWFSQFAWYWSKVKVNNICKKANISDYKLHSLRFDRQKKRPVQWKKVRPLGLVWHNNKTFLKGKLSCFSALQTGI